MSDNLILYTAIYDEREDAVSDLNAINELHNDKLIGTLDAAVVDHSAGTARIVKRLDRPRVRVIPEEFGGGELPRAELKQAAEHLAEGEAGLVVVAEPTLEKGLDRAIARTSRVVKHVLDASTDEIALELQAAL